MRFTGIVRPGRIPHGDVGHVIARRDDLARRKLGGAASPRDAFVVVRISPRKKVVGHNQVKGAKRPKAESGEGKTPAIS